MQVIPVIDVMRGQVVRAVGGQRSTYRPIVSSLCAGCDPTNMAEALLQLTESPILYMADLDALCGGAVQTAVLSALLRARPGFTLWLDAGFTDRASFDAVQRALGSAAGRVRAVLASESLRERAALAPARRSDCLLSLDQRGGQALDPAGCWDHPEQWPADVIVMTLDRVGRHDGPDVGTVQRVKAMAPDVRVIGAGGVRHADDLRAAERAGADAWLMASALHEGRWVPSQCTAA